MEIRPSSEIYALPVWSLKEWCKSYTLVLSHQLKRKNTTPPLANCPAGYQKIWFWYFKKGKKCHASAALNAGTLLSGLLDYEIVMFPQQKPCLTQILPWQGFLLWKWKNVSSSRRSRARPPSPKAAVQCTAHKILAKAWCEVQNYWWVSNTNIQLTSPGQPRHNVKESQQRCNRCIKTVGQHAKLIADTSGVQWTMMSTNILFRETLPECLTEQQCFHSSKTL